MRHRLKANDDNNDYIRPHIEKPSHQKPPSEMEMKKIIATPPKNICVRGKSPAANAFDSLPKSPQEPCHNIIWYTKNVIGPKERKSSAHLVLDGTLVTWTGLASEFI